MVKNNEKDELIFKKRILEFAQSAYYKGFPTYSSFLNLNEQSILYSIMSELPAVEYQLWGGIDLAERKMLCFSTEQINFSQFPLSIIKIEPAHQKFAEKLSHRDYLGAILNLGIEREMIGDIIIDDKIAYVFIEKNMMNYVCSQLETIRHTRVLCKEGTMNFSYSQKYQEITGTVSSVRLDSIIALAFRESRSSIVSLISGGKVFINGRLITSNSYTLKNDDIISVRGKGKFLYEGEIGMTKKDKIKVILKKYV